MSPRLALRNELVHSYELGTRAAMRREPQRDMSWWRNITREAHRSCGCYG